MDSVATADSSAGISVCEEYNLADRPPPPQPQSPRPEKRPASPHPKPASAPDRHKRAPDEGHNVKTGEAPRGRTRELSVRRKPKSSVLKSATWSNIVLNMPLHSDLLYVADFAKYLGMARTRRDTPSTGEFRNIVFLGWDADYEKEFMDDMGDSPTN
ncbi:hypothetical protein JMJ35_002810 [Cladonia borealis]|uniref:Uncharacterized protein n=1 Tax=Cladonia borealis TaxID=184061 RepID=A0AA39R6G3_9LECA|nr:hypothetical protein JMJ35_002810 [Cladonia borealis]